MRQSNLIGYLYLLPILGLITLFILYPFLTTLRLSFYHTPFGGADARFVGLENFNRLFHDEVFWKSLKNSLVWTLGNLILQLVIPMGVALLLNEQLKGVSLYRTVMLIPWIIPAVVVAIMARWMFEPNLGIINEVLFKARLIDHPVNYLGSTTNAMPTLIIVNSWKFFPIGTLLILAALQTIPDELHEAAKVDGASGWQRFLYIIFPLIGSMLWFVSFLAFVWNFNVFDLIWLTTQGGPGNTTQTLPVLIYWRAFKSFQLGEASAIAVIVALLLSVLGILYFALLAPRGEE